MDRGAWWATLHGIAKREMQIKTTMRYHLTPVRMSEWVKVTQLCPTLCDPVDYTVHGILQARILEWVAFPFSRGSSQPRNETQVSHIADRFFTSWATRETKNIQVGSLSLPQRIFPTQESNQGLLNCRCVFYQLSYQGSPQSEWPSSKNFTNNKCWRDVEKKESPSAVGVNVNWYSHYGKQFGHSFKKWE